MFLQKKSINRKINKRPKLYRMSRSFLDWIKLVGGILVFTGAGWGLYQIFIVSSFCRLSTVEVVGRTPHLSEEDIKNLAQVPFGENLLFVNLYEIEANIRRFNWVKEVRVKRNFPRGLYLRVEEHTPVAIISADDLYYMSREGKIFRKLSPSDERNYPVITGFSKEHLKNYPHYFRGKVKEALHFLNFFQERTENSSLGLSEVHYSLVEGMTAITSSPPMQLFFGRDKIQEKLNRWEEFLNMMQETEQFYRSVDLHVEGKIFARN